MSAALPGTTAPELSVVVVSFNTRGLLERCLVAVRDATVEISCEMIVVENASSDDSAEWVRAHWPQVRLMVNRENRGYAPACNQGLRAAGAPLVMALNSDAFPAVDALAAMIRHLREHPEAAAVGPRLLNADGTTQWVCARRTPELLPQWLGCTLLPAYLPALRPYVARCYPVGWYDADHETQVLSGACILYRKQTLERYGLLDERLILNYDDVEWSLRARRQGARLRYEPRAKVTHLGGGSRLIDPGTSRIADVTSTFTFWEIAFARPVALLFKLTLLSSLALSLGYSMALGIFSRSRRHSASQRMKLLTHGLRSLPRAAAGAAAPDMADGARAAR